MSAGERFKNWVEGLSEDWKDKLRGWFLRSLAEGVKKFLEDEEPTAVANVGDMITKLRENPSTPPEVKDMLDKIEGKGSWIMLVLGILMAIPMLVQAVNSVWMPGAKQMSYPEERRLRAFASTPYPLLPPGDETLRSIFPCSMT